MLERRAAPLREQAVEVMRTAIVRGEFGPGSRMKEKDLEGYLGVSRTVVRETLRQLESERLIVLQPGSGPIVARLTREEARQLYEVRGALEATAARLAAKNASGEQKRALRAVWERIDDTAVLDIQELVAIKNDFYATLISASGNDIIGEQLAGVQARISQLRAVTLSAAGRTAATKDELDRVVTAIENGDELAAYEFAHVHVMVAADIALTHLAEEDAEQ